MYTVISIIFNIDHEMDKWRGFQMERINGGSKFFSGCSLQNLNITSLIKNKK